jgi:hypothetical protein
MKGPHFLFTAIDLIKNIELKGINWEVIFKDSYPEWPEAEAYPLREPPPRILPAIFSRRHVWSLYTVWFSYKQSVPNGPYLESK